MEIWKPIENCDNYKVSNLGKVKHINGEYAKRSMSQKGYFRVSIKNNQGHSIRYDIHRLVAEYFCDKPITDEKLVVNHKNGYKKDNRATNLEWTTYKGNAQHALKNNLWKPGRYQSKTILNIEENLQFETATLAAIWLKENSKLESQICTISGNIRRCCKGGTPKAYNYHWKYN